MDRHKIVFVCREVPEADLGIRGFVQGESYEGRAYNGLVEINPRWGNGSESKLISQKLFDLYFEVYNEQVLMQRPA